MCTVRKYKARLALQPPLGQAACNMYISCKHSCIFAGQLVKQYQAMQNKETTTLLLGEGFLPGRCRRQCCEHMAQKLAAGQSCWQQDLGQGDARLLETASQRHSDTSTTAALHSDHELVRPSSLGRQPQHTAPSAPSASTVCQQWDAHSVDLGGKLLGGNLVLNRIGRYRT